MNFRLHHGCLLFQRSVIAALVTLLYGCALRGLLCFSLLFEHDSAPYIRDCEHANGFGRNASSKSIPCRLCMYRMCPPRDVLDSCLQHHRRSSTQEYDGCCIERYSRDCQGRSFLTIPEMVMAAPDRGRSVAGLKFPLFLRRNVCALLDTARRRHLTLVARLSFFEIHLTLRKYLM